LICGQSEDHFEAVRAMCNEALSSLHLGNTPSPSSNSRMALTHGPWSFAIPSELVEAAPRDRMRSFLPPSEHAADLPEVSVINGTVAPGNDYFGTLVSRFTENPETRIVDRHDAHDARTASLRLEIAETRRPRTFQQLQRFFVHRQIAVGVTC